MGPLRFILKIATRRRLISENPALNVPPSREEEPNIDPLSEDELDAALAVMKPHYRALFACLAWTGARPDELFAFRFSDCDLERNETTISKDERRLEMFLQEKSARGTQKRSRKPDNIPKRK